MSPIEKEKVPISDFVCVYDCVHWLGSWYDMVWYDIKL